MPVSGRDGLKGIVMGFFSWIMLGLLAGGIVRKLAPGRVAGGTGTTLVLGVAGAMCGGWLSDTFFSGTANDSFFSITTWFFAIIGGLLVAWVWEKLTGKPSNTQH